MKLDDKYQHMYEELLSLRKKHKYFSKELEGKFKVLRNDFDEWKSHEPKIVLPVKYYCFKNLFKKARN